MLLGLISVAAAEPLFGALDIARRGEIILQPGIEVFPVAGAGGSMSPELMVDAGFGRGFDVRAGAGLAVPLYATDDGAMLPPYNDPELAFLDLAARWTLTGDDPVYPDDQLSLGLRVSSRPFDSRYGGTGELGFGPEFATSHRLGSAFLLFRPSFLTQPGWWPDGFGYLGLATSLTVPLPWADLFVDLDPRGWFMMGSSGNSGPVLMVEPTVEARLGARVHLGARHRLIVAATWSPESFHWEKNLADYVGYHGSFGG